VSDGNNYNILYLIPHNGYSSVIHETAPIFLKSVYLMTLCQLNTVIALSDKAKDGYSIHESVSAGRSYTLCSSILITDLEA